ncbi:hypothetical protein [Sulfurimonas sp.]|uniref:hypothetical protein n=1 Tax=Sulfurimonas sp. TaxID=2022749 RepID=UPI002AB1078B|nr:hypothetical protein [Sulfurimonas sp.]
MENLPLIQKIMKISIVIVITVVVLFIFLGKTRLDSKIINYIYLNEFTTVEYLAEKASKYNEMLPIDINDNLSINSSSAEDSKLIFNFTIKNIDFKQEDTYVKSVTDYFTVKEINLIREQRCKSKNFRILIDSGNEIINAYYTKDKTHILSVVVKKSDCKKI